MFSFFRRSAESHASAYDRIMDDLANLRDRIHRGHEAIQAQLQELLVESDEHRALMDTMEHHLGPREDEQNA